MSGQHDPASAGDVNRRDRGQHLVLALWIGVARCRLIVPLAALIELLKRADADELRPLLLKIHV